MVRGWFQRTLPSATASPSASSTYSLTAAPSGAGVPGSRPWTGWHEPPVTSATSSRTWGTADWRAASTPAQVAGAGVGMAGLILSQLISPRRSTVSNTWARAPVSPAATSATTVLSSLARMDSTLRLTSACSARFSMAGLTWAQNAASKWARTCALDRADGPSPRSATGAGLRPASRAGQRPSPGPRRRSARPARTPPASRTRRPAAPPLSCLARPGTATLDGPACAPVNRASRCPPFHAAGHGMNATAPARYRRLALPSAATRAITTRDGAQDSSLAHRTSHRNRPGLPVRIAARTGRHAPNGRTYPPSLRQARLPETITRALAGRPDRSAASTADPTGGAIRFSENRR